MFDSLNFFKKKKTSQLGVELDHLSNLYLNPLSSQKIKKAVSFADKAHQGQFRKSGEPFIIHPINVGMILASLKSLSTKWEFKIPKSVALINLQSSYTFVYSNSLFTFSS